jgi:hypothetical protein
MTQDAEEQAFLRAINNYRGQNGAGPLTLSPSLTRGSTWFAIDMANYSYFPGNHVDRLGRTFDARLIQCDVTNGYLSENIAAWYVNGADVFEGWRNSAGHNRNMLDPQFRSIGISRHYNAASQAGWYWVTNFSAEAVTAPVPVNNFCDTATIDVQPYRNTGTLGETFVVSGVANCPAAIFQFWVTKVEGPHISLFDVNNQWQTGQWYSANNSYRWTPPWPGYYYVTFWVRNPNLQPANGAFDTYRALNLMVIN